MRVYFKKLTAIYLYKKEKVPTTWKYIPLLRSWVFRCRRKSINISPLRGFCVNGNVVLVKAPVGANVYRKILKGINLLFQTKKAPNREPFYILFWIY
jgi:hypothetical protein